MNLQRFYNFIFGENSRHRNRSERVKELYAGGVLRAATQSFVAPNPLRIWGIDISGKWDGNVDLSATREIGASFVIGKCIDGTVPTRLWRENRNRALDVGLIVGEYAWLYPDNKVSCAAQARAVWDLIKAEPKQMPLTIDFEWTRYMGVSANPNYSDLDKWVTEFTRLSGYKPGFYSAAGYMNQVGTMPRALRDKFSFFWVANYGVSAPTMPIAFLPSEWDFWQFSATGEAVVIAPNDTGKLEVDLDYWRGDLESLKELAGLGQVSQPEEEATMTTLYGEVITSTLNIRTGAGTNFEDLGNFNLYVGDKVESNNQLGNWWQLSKIVRKSGLIEQPADGAQWWASTGGGLYIRIYAPPPPVVTFPPEVTLTIGSASRVYVRKA
jgi:GH25 family lysozyme M1 (1,4-beta-N-acetylmuramidase)